MLGRSRLLSVSGLQRPYFSLNPKPAVVLGFNIILAEDIVEGDPKWEDSGHTDHEIRHLRHSQFPTDQFNSTSSAFKVLFTKSICTSQSPIRSLRSGKSKTFIQTSTNVSVFSCSKPSRSPLRERNGSEAPSPLPLRAPRPSMYPKYRVPLKGLL